MFVFCWLLDAATANLLDIDDGPTVIVENIDNQKSHVDNHHESENNNTIWVRSKLKHRVLQGKLDVFQTHDKELL